MVGWAGSGFGRDDDDGDGDDDEAVDATGEGTRGDMHQW